MAPSNGTHDSNVGNNIILNFRRFSIENLASPQLFIVPPDTNPASIRKKTSDE